MSRRYTFNCMQASEFRQACDELDLKKDLFCFITGSNPTKFDTWSNGTTDIPAWVPVFLVLMTLPGARQKAYRTAKVFFDAKASQPAPEEDQDHGSN